MRRLASLTFGLAAATLAWRAQAAPDPLNGARLGITVGEWESLRPPAGIGLTAIPTCTSVEKVSAVDSKPLSAVDEPTSNLACVYASRFGRYVLPHSFRLDDRYRAGDLRYLFVAGKLSEIQFSTSIDAFNDVAAMLKRRFGPPTAVARDRVRTSAGPRQRVRLSWKTPTGDVRLVDPSSDPVLLSVSIRGAQQGRRSTPSTKRSIDNPMRADDKA